MNQTALLLMHYLSHEIRKLWSNFCWDSPSLCRLTITAGDVILTTTEWLTLISRWISHGGLREAEEYALPQDHLPRPQVPTSCSSRLPVVSPSELGLPCAFYRVLLQGIFGQITQWIEQFQQNVRSFLLGGARWILKTRSFDRNLRSFLETIF